jgi:hypothetical protein
VIATHHSDAGPTGGAVAQSDVVPTGLADVWGVDPAVLAELPADIQAEIRAEYTQRIPAMQHSELPRKFPNPGPPPGPPPPYAEHVDPSAALPRSVETTSTRPLPPLPLSAVGPSAPVKPLWSPPPPPPPAPRPTTASEAAEREYTSQLQVVLVDGQV